MPPLKTQKPPSLDADGQQLVISLQGALLKAVEFAKVYPRFITW